MAGTETNQSEDSDRKRPPKGTGDPDRASTGIEGLDAILGGGLQRHHTYLVEGAPGAGKTTLGLQFSIAGAMQGERVLFLTTGESEEELHAVARSHGWSLRS